MLYFLRVRKIPFISLENIQPVLFFIFRPFRNSNGIRANCESLLLLQQGILIHRLTVYGEFHSRVMY